jgi:hypothetical protein
MGSNSDLRQHKDDLDQFDYQFNDPQLVVHLNFNPIHVSYALLFIYLDELCEGLSLSTVIKG